MITLIAILASLVRQELLTHGSNIVKPITVFAIGAEVAENLCEIVSSLLVRGEGERGRK